MRGFYVAIIVAFVALTIILAAQNAQTVAMAFPRMGIIAPLAFAVFVVNALGAATGGSLYALPRRSVQGSRGAVWARSNR